MQGTHWLLAVVLLAFCSLQILLVFHNETLRAACLDHFRLLRRYGLHVGWLFVVSLLHFFVLVVANAFLSQALGQWTWPAVAWGLLSSIRCCGGASQAGCWRVGYVSSSVASPAAPMRMNWCVF